MPSTSRAWFVDRYGGPERLVLRERSDPVPGPGEVLVRSAAIGLNFADLFVRSGDYPRAPKPPFVPGMEISGTVEAVGGGVTDVAPGRRVVAVPIFGGHAEKVVAKATHVFPLPDGVDLVEAAAVPVAFLTAWYACARAEVAEGDRVVVTAAAGGVGSALLQVLREKRAKTIALVGSEAKAAACRALGATEVGTYESADALIERAGGRVDVVVDAIGGRVFRRLWRRLGPSGRYVLYGFAAASGASGVAKLTAARELLAMGLFSPYSFVQSCRTLIGFNLSLLPDRTGELQRMAREVFALWKDGRIRPVLGPRFAFERLPDAHRALAGRGTTGKVVIAVG
ncbi:MAG TPA: zinc-binding dehydrogenase [Thermoanaerobaculia bacterium]|nr:zinc-binding dehydrogenase [Thermoanaerobaculia bacterium]